MIAARPWRIGWFGAIRCRRSLLCLAEIARQHPGLVEVDIRGRITEAMGDDFQAIVDATPVPLRTRVTPTTDLTDVEDDTWVIIHRAVAALRPRLAVVVTDRLIAFGDDGFDPGSLSRFFVEHARGVPNPHLWIVVDPAPDGWSPRRLVEFARSIGIRVNGTSLWRSPGVDYHHAAIDEIVRQRYERIVVADTTYASADPRVVVHQRVTR